MGIKLLLCITAENYHMLPQQLKAEVMSMLTPETDAEEAAVAGHAQQLQTASPALPAAAEAPVEAAPKRTRVRKPKADAAAPGPVQDPQSAAAAVQPQHAQWAYAPPMVNAVAPPPPVQVGDVRLYPPAMGHPTQQNGAFDFTTGQPVSIPHVASAPYVPPMQNTPTQVVPMAAPGPAQPTPAMWDVNTVRQLAIRVFRDPAMGGQQMVDAALQASGVGTLMNLNSQNAPALHHFLSNPHLLNRTGG